MINTICVGKNSLWMGMVNLVYVCVQYVLHIPGWGGQVHFFRQEYPGPALPTGALGSIRDTQCFISRFFFSKTEKSSNFWVLWMLSLLLLSPSLFLFTGAAHLRISPPGLAHSCDLLASLLSFSDLCTISPWVRLFWKTFNVFFFASSLFL